MNDWVIVEVAGSEPEAELLCSVLRGAGIEVVMTDLRRLRDPNPVYSAFWRVFVRPFGSSTRGWVPSPMGRGHKVTIRSYLEALNFKANHRKTLIADCEDGCVNDASKVAPGICGCGFSGFEIIVTLCRS